MERLDELSLGAGLEVGGETGCCEEKELCLIPEPSREEVVSTMETRRVEEEEEEERWRRLFPDIRKCSIVLVRPRADPLKVWSLTGTERRRSKRVRTRDVTSDWDWMEPLDPENGESRTKRFVKKVEVKEHGPEDGPEKPQRRLRLTHCSEPASERDDLTKELQQGDHNYCLDLENQSEEARLPSSGGHREGDRCVPAEKKNVPSMVLRKVTADQWVLGRAAVKEEEEEEEEVQTAMEKRREELSASGRKRRRQACGSCAACLRKNCARCAFCLDMRKFGGPCRLKQKCVMRRCLVVNAMKKWTREQNRIQAGEETDSTDAQPESNHWRGWRRWRHERDPAGGQEVKSRGLSGRWTPLWGEKHLKLMSDRGLLLNQEEQKKPGSGDTEVRKRRWMKRRRWGQTRAATDSKIRKEWDSLLMKEEEEEKPSQLPVSTGPSGPDGPSGPPGPPGPSGPSGPSGPLTGTHVQLNLTLDSGHLPSSILSDSALTCLSGLLPQEGSVLHVSTGLTFIPPPAAAVQSLQLKEEEEPVGIEQYGRGGGYEEQEEHEQEVWTGISEMGKYYEVEVELVGPDYNQRTLRAASPEPNDITEVPSTCDLTCERPEFLPLNPEGFGLLRSGVRNAVAGGRSLLRLLKMLRRTVLPAHWVAVLAAGPELQLLQCSRLSSMTDTIVHVQSDRSFYISIQTWPLPDSHRVYKEHAHRVAHLSQLVTLLLDLERLATCRGLRVQVPPGLQQVRSAGCHLLVARPFHTCLPCLLEEESEEDEESEDEDGTMSLDC